MSDATIGNSVDREVETVFTSDMTNTTCTGTRYNVNPDAPGEGTDIHHDTACPAHPEPITTGRQTCANCLATVGTLPTGQVRPYTTRHYSEGRRFHFCADTDACARERAATEMGAERRRTDAAHAAIKAAGDAAGEIEPVR